jgi:hypothetical protein
MFGAKCNAGFIIKCLLKESPFAYVSGSGLGSVFIFGWLGMIAESPLDRVAHGGPLHTYNNSCWEAICTMTTIGFGDIYPKTFLGRFSAFSCAIVGLAVVSLLVVCFTNVLTMDSPESSSYLILKKLEYKKMIKETAVRLIITINRKCGQDKKDQYRRFSQIKSLVEEFRFWRRVYRNIMTPNMADEMNKNFGQLSGHLTDLKEMLVDQNEWYEEIFYDNDCTDHGNPQEHDHDHGHDRVFETKDLGDHKHQSGEKNDQNTGIPQKIDPSKKFGRQNSKISKQVWGRGSTLRETGFGLPGPRNEL